MSSVRYTAQIDQIRELSRSVRELTLRLVDPGPKFLHFHSGQSIAVEILFPDNKEPTVRYYSLASPSTQTGSLRLLVSLADQGDGENFLAQQVEGAIVHFHGPFGSFSLQDDKDKHILFVATGTGIAPFLSMLSALLTEPRSTPITLYWGLRNERDLYYQEELQGLADLHTSFSFVTTLSQADQEWSGATGRVTEHVSSLPSVSDLAVYVCGHQTMVNEVTEILRGKGPCLVYREQC